MARYIHLEPHLSADELARRYRGTTDPVERSHWHFLWLLARGFTATAIASLIGYSAYWIGQIARRYNARGPEGVKDQRRLARPHRHLLTATRHEELRAALSGAAPQHDRWNGRTVAAWMAQRLARPICRQLGWVYLRRLGARLRMPRPRHVQADPQAQVDFRRRLRPLLREVATAFPQARVELWAMDEHRIGLKPILRKVWSLDNQRPVAPVQPSLRLALSRRLCPSGLRSHGLSPRDVGEYAAFRSRTRCLCPSRWRESQQADRPRAGSRGLAQHATPACARPPPPALPPTLIQ